MLLGFFWTLVKSYTLFGQVLEVARIFRYGQEIFLISNPLLSNWFVGNKKETLTQPKCKSITSHTTRKTFITNSLLLGMESEAIKKITNIKKDVVLDKYMKVTEAFTDEQMDKAWG